MVRFLAMGLLAMAFVATVACGGPTSMMNAAAISNIDGDPEGELARCEATGMSTEDCCATHRVPACPSVGRGP
jgi:hypothetical protein